MDYTKKRALRLCYIPKLIGENCIVCNLPMESPWTVVRKDTDPDVFAAQHGAFDPECLLVKLREKVGSEFILTPVQGHRL